MTCCSNGIARFTRYSGVVAGVLLVCCCDVAAGRQLVGILPHHHVLLSIIDDFLIDLMPPLWRETPPDDHDSIVTCI